MKPSRSIFLALLVLGACGGAAVTDDTAVAKKPRADEDEELRAGGLGEGRDPESPWIALVEPKKLSGPIVLASDVVEVQERSAQLVLTADGAVKADFEVVLSNESERDAEVCVGFAWKTPGSRCPEPPAPLVAESGETIPWNREDIRSPPEHRAVYCISTFSLKTPIPAGSARRFRTGMELRAERRVGPTTVFGFEERFRHNLQNFAWSHASQDLSARAASVLQEGFASIFLRHDALRRKLKITCSEDLGDCLRGVAFDTGGKSAAQSSLNGVDITDAPRVSFSWSLEPEDLDEETALVKRLLNRYTKDLRLRARLLTLLRAQNAPQEQLVAVCSQLLGEWTDERAEKQLLTGRNDHRSALYATCLEIAGTGGGEVQRRAMLWEDEARTYIQRRKKSSLASPSDAMLSSRLGLEP